MTVRNDMKYSLMNLSGFKIDLIDAPWAKVFDFVAHAKPGTDKKALPLIKLARFGVQPSPQKGNLRHDANVLSIFGLEGDYDGEVMTPRTAVALLEQFGIRAAVVTSFSHDPARPRWRVLCPLSKPFNPGARRALMGRLNGALTGVLSNESFTLSQAFFIGGRVGGVYEALHTFEDPEDGRCIDELDELDDIAMMPERDKREDKGPAELVTLPADKFEELRQALSVIDSDERWQWVRIGHALHHLGDAGFALFDEWSQKSDKYDAADCRERWEGFSGARATYKTVFKEAYRCGWAGPERRMPEPPPMDDVPLEAYDSAPLERGSTWERPLVPVLHVEQPAPKYQLLSANDLMAMRPLRWLVRGVLPEQGLAAIFGASGSGKSFLAFDLCAAVGGGAEWFGKRVVNVPVTYVALEGEHGFRQRALAWQERFGGPLPDSMKFILGTFDMRNRGNIQAMCDAIEAAGHRGGLLVIDTLNRAAAGADENSSTDMGELIDAAKSLQVKLGGVVLLVHHSGKDSSKGMRGHSSLHAALDAAIEVCRTDDLREWKVAKSKDDMDGVSYPFKLSVVEVERDENGDPITSCVVDQLIDAPQAPKRPLAPQGENQRAVWNALGPVFAATNGRVPAGAPSDVPHGRPCLELEDAVAKVKDCLLVAPDRRMERARAAIQGLVTRGLLAHSGGFIWVK